MANGRLPPTLRFEFFMPPWLEWLQRTGLRLKFDQLTWHLVHLLWQFLAYPYVRKHLAAWRVDIIHHVTFSGIRHPTLMGRLPIPLVLGPLGGGERAPFALRRGFGWRAWLIDLVRDLHTWLIRFDPITRFACADALVVYVKTARSREALPARYHDKIEVRLEIGTHEAAALARPEPRPGQPLKLLYAGRFLHWKGMHLGLMGLAELLGRGVEARLTMVGRGPAEIAWRRLATALGIDHAIEWQNWVPHDQVGKLYCSHHALLYPSLHDSSGNVVLESLNHGLPVVCLDLGGPAEMVDPTCGRIIATSGRSEAECAQALADALEELARSDALLGQLSVGARGRAQSCRWPVVVASLYEDVTRRLHRAGRIMQGPARALGAGSQPLSRTSSASVAIPL